MTSPNDINYNLYDYFPISNLPDTLVQAVKGQFNTAPFTELTGHYETLIRKLTRRTKGRKYVLGTSPYLRVRTGDLDTDRMVTQVHVHDADANVYLGKFWMEDAKWCITNGRISDAMSRKSVRRTEDDKKAVKIIEEFFYGPTIEEAVVAANSHANGLSSDAVYTAERKVRDIGSVFVRTEVLNHIIAPRLSEFLESSTFTPGERMLLPTLPERLDAYHAAERIRTSMNTGERNTVVIRGDTYYVAVGSEYSAYTSYTLPAYIKLAVAKLKLSPDNAMLEGVGIRVNATSFVVFKETL